MAIISVLTICLLSFFRYYFFLSSKSKTGKYLEKGPCGDLNIFSYSIYRINMSGVLQKMFINTQSFISLFFLRLVSKIFDDEILFKKSWLQIVFFSF